MPSGVLTVIAAETAEKNETPFYVAGGVLAAWAVISSAVGITFSRRTAPTPSLLGGAFIVVSVVLVGAAIATAVVTSQEEEAQPEAEGGAAAEGALRLAAPSSGELAFDKKALSAKPGEVTIEMENPSRVPHNVTIERGGRDVAESRTVSAGSATVTARLERPGRYVFYCSVDAHRQGGMEGTLTVR